MPDHDSIINGRRWPRLLTCDCSPGMGLSDLCPKCRGTHAFYMVRGKHYPNNEKGRTEAFAAMQPDINPVVQESGRE